MLQTGSPAFGDTRVHGEHGDRSPDGPRLCAVKFQRGSQEIRRNPDSVDVAEAEEWKCIHALRKVSQLPQLRGAGSPEGARGTLRVFPSILTFPYPAQPSAANTPP
jgi:hypothetical protein